VFSLAISSRRVESVEESRRRISTTSEDIADKSNGADP
jgi:hypothetical protein